MGVNNVKMQGKWVHLEEVKPKFFPYIISWRNNPQLNKYIIQPFVLTEKLEQLWYEEYLRDSSRGMMIMIAEKTGVPFGTLGFSHYDLQKGICIGKYHIIGDMDYRSSPEYVEAQLLCHDYLFNQMGVNKVFSHVMLDNSKTASFLMRLGAVENAQPDFPEFLSMQGQTLKEYVLTKENYLHCRDKIMAVLYKAAED